MGWRDCEMSRPKTKSPLYVSYNGLSLSGRQDSNLRPPVPKTGALPDCATPRAFRCGLLHF